MLDNAIVFCYCTIKWDIQELDQISSSKKNKSQKNCFCWTRVSLLSGLRGLPESCWQLFSRRIFCTRQALLSSSSSLPSFLLQRTAEPGWSWALWSDNLCTHLLFLPLLLHLIFLLILLHRCLALWCHCFLSPTSSSSWRLVVSPSRRIQRRSWVMVWQQHRPLLQNRSHSGLQLMQQNESFHIVTFVWPPAEGWLFLHALFFNHQWLKVKVSNQWPRQPC